MSASDCFDCIHLLRDSASEEQVMGEFFNKKKINYDSLAGFLSHSVVRTGLRILEEEGYVCFEKGKYIFDKGKFLG